MNIIFATINDYFSLPHFFDRFFSKTSQEDHFKVLLVRPVYRNKNIISMAAQYLESFGLKEFMFFSAETTLHIFLSTIKKSKPGQKHYSVAQALGAHNIQFVRILRNLNDKSVLKMLKDFDTDLIISIGCPQIFEKDFINLPKKGCLNLHGALLPKYRGVLPSFWMLKNGEKYAGNTFFFVNEKIDGGDVLIQEKFPINEDDTLRSFIFRSKNKACDIILKAIEMIRDGNYKTYPISVKEGSYFSWPERKDVKEFLANGRKLR